MVIMRVFGLFASVVVVILTTLASEPAQAQVPGLPAAPKPAASTPPAKEDTIAAPTKDNPDATVAETAGPIAVDNTVSDRDVKRKLQKLLPKYPGVRDIDVEVEDGVVTLTGQVEDDDVRDRLRDFVRRVQGVNLVINQTMTDAQVLTARQFAIKQLQEYWNVISRKWLLAIMALAFILVATALARLFNQFSETLLWPLSGNVLLRSVLGSVIATLILIGGIMGALKVLGLSQAVLSFLGLAGVAALAVGFAFRDITENFIASILLGLRRPFRVGDYIEISGQAGVVKSLNTRATLIVTLEGNQIRILNSTIYKEILVNKSASTSVRGTFDVMVPYDASIASATDAVSKALVENESIDKDPQPRALVEALEPNGVRIRAYFWFPAKGVDGFKLNSDVKLAAKVALQKAGVVLGIPPVSVLVPREVPIAMRRALEDGRHHDVSSCVTPDQARANLRHDSHAAETASAETESDSVNLMEHALNVAEDRVGDEGENLLDEDSEAKEPANTAVSSA
jgi:small-conductance mechanosensitive channel